MKVWGLTLFSGIWLLFLSAIFSNSPQYHDVMVICGISGAIIFIVCISLLVCGKKERNLSKNREILHPILFHEPTAILAISGRNEQITNAHAKYIQNTILDQLEQTNELEKNNKV